MKRLRRRVDMIQRVAVIVNKSCLGNREDLLNCLLGRRDKRLAFEMGLAGASMNHDAIVVVVVDILRPVEPKARLPKGIGRPAACLAYLS
jgi:hypothetical protein